MFEELSNKLQEISNKVSNKGFLNAENIVSALQEVKIALLEADVNFRVVNIFLKRRNKKKPAQPKVNLFVEDTALYFEEWRFFPGVFIKWMLQSLGPEGIYRSLQAFEKTAYAECCIAFYEPFSQKQYYFQGRISGMIVLPRGEKNFGWDSIFMPHGHQKTFAEMGSEEKNSISHRYLAAQKFLFFLEKRLS